LPTAKRTATRSCRKSGAGAVSRLLEDGLLEESDDRPDPEMDDTRRRYYRLTNFGGRVLAAETERLAELVRAARSTKLVRKLKPA
jgi:hypothetical protein